MDVLDSRRLTGPGLLLDRPGAVLDLRLDEKDADRAIAAWESAARRLLCDAGWPDEQLFTRRFPGGVSLALSAPVDGLYAATELNELAWETAAAELGEEPPPDYEAGLRSLKGAIARESNRALVALRSAARARGLTFLAGEDQVSVGSGTGVLVWPEGSLPDPASVDWSRAHDVPIALVTGSNGKTTVVRLLAAMIRAAGRVPGYTSTDGVTVGTVAIDQGDFSGPSGARMVLRRAEVEMAVLETARGGLLRRGLSVERADAAVITNIAEDHLGEFGIESLAELAETKLLVAKALGSRGTLVLNADDPMLVERSPALQVAILWFSLEPTSPLIAAHTRAGGTAVLADQGQIVLTRGSERETIAAVAEVPITFRGTAEHNVANVLAAVGLGAALGLEPEVMAGALRRFGDDPLDNAGRATLLEVGGVHILLDYAHNPHGMSALVALAQKLPAQRRLVMVGQAGDRSDEAIRELARAAWPLRPDHVVVKEMDEFLRGRAVGEVPALLADEFSRLGMPEEAVTRVGPDIAGVQKALEWARAGDLLVLAVHQDRRAVFELLNGLTVHGWKAGETLPSSGAGTRGLP
ncbi:MAG: Mur ligase family protein [Gemmatimonadales bacterium]